MMIHMCHAYCGGWICRICEKGLPMARAAACYEETKAPSGSAESEYGDDQMLGIRQEDRMLSIASCIVQQFLDISAGDVCIFNLIRDKGKVTNKVSQGVEYCGDRLMVYQRGSYDSYAVRSRTAPG